MSALTFSLLKLAAELHASSVEQCNNFARYREAILRIAVHRKWRSEAFIAASRELLNHNCSSAQVGCRRIFITNEYASFVI